MCNSPTHKEGLREISQCIYNTFKNLYQSPFEMHGQCQLMSLNFPIMSHFKDGIIFSIKTTVSTVTGSSDVIEHLLGKVS